MALKVYNGSTFDDVLIPVNDISSATVNITTSFQQGGTVTAPNTTNKATGVFFHLNFVPTAGDIQIALYESGVSKVTVTANNADLQVGWNYVRFGTPYQFTTTSAGAYSAYIKNTSVTSGLVSRHSSLVRPALFITYDTATSLGSSDDFWLMGYHNSGLTPLTYTASGTSLAFGSGTDTNFSTTTRWTLGAALTVGNGGTFKQDDTASCTVTITGPIQVTAGGVYDKRANASDISIVSTLIMNCASDGQFPISTNLAYGGTFLSTGMTVTTTGQYASGVGSTASPLTYQAAHGLRVNDELIIPGLTYNGNQKKFVKTVVNSTQVTLSDTAGGAESAITNTPAVGVWIDNMTRNSVIKSSNSSFGFSFFSESNYASDLSYCRLEYPNCISGKSIILDGSDNGTTFDGIVLYHNSANARSSLIITGTTTRTHNYVTLFDPKGSNFAGSTGFQFLGANNRTINHLHAFGDPSGTSSVGGAVSFITSATNNTVNHLHAYGLNQGNSPSGSAINIYNSAGQIFNNSTVDSTRQQAIYGSSVFQTQFNNCDLGKIGTNTKTLTTDTNTLNDILFNNSHFGSDTAVSNYANQLPNSLIRIHKYNNTDNRHRWYTPNGINYSSGATLDRTTVATAGSLAVATAPETATGLQHIFPVPVNIGETISHYGKFWCNSTFLADSGCTLVAELYLPGSLIGSPDQTVTLTKTTDPTSNNAVWRLGLVNTSTVKDEALIRLVAKNANGTAGAEAYYDDMDGGTNSITALDIWYQGQPAAFQLMPQTLGDSAANAAAVWGYTGSDVPGSKGADVSTIKKVVKLIRNLLV